MTLGVVTYYDFGPSHAETASPRLRAWAARARSQAGAVEATLLGEVNRSDRFALVETWTEAALLKAHQASGARGEASIAAGMASPPDERIGEPFSIGRSRAAGPEALYVLIHVDVVPFNLDAVGEWLTTQAEAARAAAGALRCEVWRQVGRPNHFTVIQAWADREAYARHVESPAARAFRERVMSVKGALYDERLYRRLE